MKTSIIAWSADRLEQLRHGAISDGYDVVQTFTVEQPYLLQDLLKQVMGEVLIIECQVTHQMNDLAVLEQFIKEHPSKEVVVLTTERTADLMIAAMQAGVREVLIWPLSPLDLSAALHRLSQRKKSSTPEPIKRAKRVVFLSCKGGSGATFLATNFAYYMSQKMSTNTIFLDLDLQEGDAVYYVSPGPGKSNVTEITRQIERLDTKLLASSVLHIANNFDLISAPEESDINHAISPMQLERLVEIAGMSYDMVVMDVERVMTPLTMQALDMADVIYLVMESLLPFVRDAKRIIAKCRSLGYDDQKLCLILNRYEKSDIIDLAQIEKIVGLKVSHTIVSSFQDVAQAINTGVSIIQVNPNHDIVEDLKDMALQFSPAGRTKRVSWINRLMGN
jgi:pilus assembly protein CpaE